MDPSERMSAKEAINHPWLKDQFHSFSAAQQPAAHELQVPRGREEPAHHAMSSPAKPAEEETVPKRKYSK